MRATTRATGRRGEGAGRGGLVGRVVHAVRKSRAPPGRALRPAEGIGKFSRAERARQAAFGSSWCTSCVPRTGPQVEHDADEARLLRRFATEAQRLREREHRLVVFEHVAVQAFELAALRPAHEAAHQVTAQAQAGDVMADEDREFGFAARVGDRRARDGADERFAGRQGLGRDEREFALGVGARQSLSAISGVSSRTACRKRCRISSGSSRAKPWRSGSASAGRIGRMSTSRPLLSRMLFVPRGESVAGRHSGSLPERK